MIQGVVTLGLVYWEISRFYGTITLCLICFLHSLSFTGPFLFLKYHLCFSLAQVSDTISSASTDIVDQFMVDTFTMNNCTCIICDFYSGCNVYCSSATRVHIVHAIVHNDCTCIIYDFYGGCNVYCSSATRVLLHVQLMPHHHDSASAHICKWSGVGTLPGFAAVQ